MNRAPLIDLFEFAIGLARNASCDFSASTVGCDRECLKETTFQLVGQHDANGHGGDAGIDISSLLNAIMRDAIGHNHKGNASSVVEQNKSKKLFDWLNMIKTNSGFNINVLLVKNGVSYSVEDFEGDAKIILKGFGSEKVMKTAQKWLEARREFLPEFFGNAASGDFFPSKDRLVGYLNAHHALLRELIAFSKLGGFAFYDEGTLRWLTSVVYAECIYSDNKICVPLYSPTMLNSLHHVMRFTTHYLGFHEDAAGAIKYNLYTDRDINAALDISIVNRINEHFEYPLRIFGTDFFITPALFDIEKPSQSSNMFVGKKLTWNDSVKKIHPIRLFEKIRDFVITPDVKDNENVKVLLVGTVDDKDVKSLRDLLKMYCKTKCSIALWREVSDDELSWLENWDRHINKYDLIFVLDCHGVYEYVQVNTEDTLSAYESDYNQTMAYAKPNSTDYETATAAYFEPKFNLYMSASDYIGSICNGISEHRRPFKQKRMLQHSVLHNMCKRIEGENIQTAKILFFVSEIPSDVSLDTYLHSNLEVCRREMYETNPILILQALKPNGVKSRDCDIMKTLLENRDEKTLYVSAWSIIKAIHSDIEDWLEPYFHEGDSEHSKHDTLDLIMLLRSIFVFAKYEGDESGRFNVRFCVYENKGSDNVKAYASQVIERAKTFVKRFVELACVPEWERLFKNDSLVRGFLHCAFQNAFLSSLFGGAKNNNDLLFLYRMDTAPNLQTWCYEETLYREIPESVEAAFEKKPDMTRASINCYYTKTLRQLDKPVYNNSESEIAARKMIEKAFNPTVGSSNIFSEYGAYTYRAVCRIAEQSCIDLNLTNSYIYSNARKGRES